MEDEMETENDENPVHPLALVAVDVQENPESNPDPLVTYLDEESNQSTSSSSSKKRTYDDEKDEGSSCPICLDDWTNCGEHRICALKCGHVFGHKCILRWLSMQSKKCCPTCKKKSKKEDIRFIYANKLIAMDATEFVKQKQELEQITEERNKLKAELATFGYRELQLKNEIVQLKLRLDGLAKPIVNNLEKVILYMEKGLELSKYGGSRTFDARADFNLLVASLKSPTNLFNGYGLKQINISDYRTLAFIPAHSHQIRDLKFHEEHNWILTASMDKTFKVINNNEKSVMYQFPHEMPIWSCCWDQNNPFGLFVGTQNGIVIKYDIRQLTQSVASFPVEGDMSPVVSVVSVRSYPGNVLPQGGVLSCKLNSLWLLDNANNSKHSLSLDGPFISMAYQPQTKQLLVSSRPSIYVNHARHTLCTLERDQDKIACNVVHSFKGGGMQKLLSKSCFLTHTNDYVAAHQEDSKSVFLWSINTGQRVARIAAHESVLDLKGLKTDSADFLVSLTDKKLEFFKFAS